MFLKEDAKIDIEDIIKRILDTIEEQEAVHTCKKKIHSEFNRKSKDCIQTQLPVGYEDGSTQNLELLKDDIRKLIENILDTLDYECEIKKDMETDSTVVECDIASDKLKIQVPEDVLGPVSTLNTLPVLPVHLAQEVVPVEKINIFASVEPEEMYACILKTDLTDKIIGDIQTEILCVGRATCSDQIGVETDEREISAGKDTARLHHDKDCTGSSSNKSAEYSTSRANAENQFLKNGSASSTDNTYSNEGHDRAGSLDLEHIKLEKKVLANSSQSKNKPSFIKCEVQKILDDIVERCVQVNQSDYNIDQHLNESQHQDAFNNEKTSQNIDGANFGKDPHPVQLVGISVSNDGELDAVKQHEQFLMEVPVNEDRFSQEFDSMLYLEDMGKITDTMSAFGQKDRQNLSVTHSQHLETEQACNNIVMQAEDDKTVVDDNTLKETIEVLELDIKEKENTLRILQLVKVHSQKINLQEMTTLVSKWKNSCRTALTELQKVAIMPDGSNPTINLLLGHFNIEPNSLNL